MPRQITAQEANAILAQDEADHVPYRVLNKPGQAAVVDFVAQHSKAPNAQSMGAWFGEAERCANDTPVGHTVTMEMGRFATSSGVPAVLSFDPEHFDWVISDAATA